MPPFRPQALSRQPYFAYGSNLVATQMHQRCPAAHDMGMARLDGWRFLINQEGYATIVPDPSAYVLGVLWSLTSACEAALDDYEEIATGLYSKAYLEIQGTPAARVPRHKRPARAPPGRLSRSHHCGGIQAWL